MIRRFLIAAGIVMLALSTTTPANAAKTSGFADGNGSCHDNTDGSPKYTVPVAVANQGPELASPTTWDFSYTYRDGTLSVPFTLGKASGRGETYALTVEILDHTTPL